MKPLTKLATLILTTVAVVTAFDTASYTKLLQKYVDAQGRLDYAALKRNDAATVNQLAAALESPVEFKSRNAALAYYLNAYNLLIWKNAIDRLPNFKGVSQDNYAFFKQPSYKVNGQETNLDALEKQVIRTRFGDGRVHFVLNCASGGCPILPRTAFSAERVQAQLANETAKFINEKRNVSFDAANNSVTLSKIFEWYAADFVKPGANILDYINKYRKEKIPTAAKVTYAEYDWRLNDKSLPAR